MPLDLKSNYRVFHTNWGWVSSLKKYLLFFTGMFPGFRVANFLLTPIGVKQGVDSPQNNQAIQ
jgi:nucleoid-associated protein YejK